MGGVLSRFGKVRVVVGACRTYCTNYKWQTTRDGGLLNTVSEDGRGVLSSLVLQARLTVSTAVVTQHVYTGSNLCSN